MFQIAWGAHLARNNSLTSHSHVSHYNNSPTLSRSYEHHRRKSCNLISDCTKESPLPKINEGQTSPEIKEEEEMNMIRRIFKALEPKGYMKERDEFSLYIFSPNNR